MLSISIYWSICTCVYMFVIYEFSILCTILVQVMLTLQLVFNECTTFQYSSHLTLMLNWLYVANRTWEHGAIRVSQGDFQDWLIRVLYGIDLDQ